MGFFMATMVIVPIVMAAVTVLVGDRVSRYVNLIAGLSLGAFGIYAVVRETSADDFNVHILMLAVAAALAFLIAGLSFVGLRQSASQAAAPETEQGRPREQATV